MTTHPHGAPPASRTDAPLADAARASAALRLRRRTYRLARNVGANLEQRPAGGYLVHHPALDRPRPARDLADVTLILVYLPTHQPGR